jgi:hypothetical protein
MEYFIAAIAGISYLSGNISLLPCALSYICRGLFHSYHKLYLIAARGYFIAAVDYFIACHGLFHSLPCALNGRFLRLL